MDEAKIKKLINFAKVSNMPNPFVAVLVGPGEDYGGGRIIMYKGKPLFYYQFFGPIVCFHRDDFKWNYDKAFLKDKKLFIENIRVYVKSSGFVHILDYKSLDDFEFSDQKALIAYYLLKNGKIRQSFGSFILKDEIAVFTSDNFFVILHYV